MEPIDNTDTAANLAGMPSTDKHRGNVPMHIRSAPLLTEVLEALYDSQINAGVSIQSFFDAGWHWRVSLGDELDGFTAEKIFIQKDFAKEAAIWLIETARSHYPDSLFAKKYAAPLRDEAVREIERKPGK
jgi:hypothetical protein